MNLRGKRMPDTPTQMLKQSCDHGDVDAVVGRIRQELRTLLQQRDETIRKIGTVKKTVVGLAALFGDGVLDHELMSLLGYKDSQRHPGLTRECRFVLMNSDKPLGAREVCEQVQQRLPSVGNHKDPLASVTTVLNRLVEYGEAWAVEKGGRHKWAWVSENLKNPTPDD